MNKKINVNEDVLEDLIKSDKIIWKEPIVLTQEEFDKMFNDDEEITDINQL